MIDRIKVIRASFKKEFIQYIRYPSWIIASIIWPLIIPFFYVAAGIAMAGPDGSGYDTFNNIAGTDSYIGYIIIGTMVWSWVNMTMWSFGSYLRSEQTRGTLESNWLCPINKFDLFIGQGIFSIVTSLMSLVISILEYKYIYGVTFNATPLGWIVSFMIFLPGVYGFGLMFSSLILVAKEAGSTVQIIRGIITIFCGISYPIIMLPEWMKVVSSVLPFTYGINASRKLLLNGTLVTSKEVSYDIFMCILLGVAMFIIGRILFSSLERKVRISGSLERF